MRVAQGITLTEQEFATLTTWSRGRSTPARLVLRAKIILAAAQGMKNQEIAAHCDTSKPTVIRWRKRFAEQRLVLSCDEKSQIQALDRTQKGLPIVPGRCGTMTHDYKRNGTTTLFAALNVADGVVIGECMPQWQGSKASTVHQHACPSRKRNPARCGAKIHPIVHVEGKVCDQSAAHEWRELPV